MSAPLLIAVAGIYLNPQVAQAAAPACFEVKEGEFVKEGSCIGYTVQTGTIQNDKCYSYPSGSSPGKVLKEVDCTGIRSLIRPSASPSPTGGVRPPSGSYDTTTNASIGAVEDSPLFKQYLIPVINILSAGVVATSAVFMVVAGIQYSSGRDNPQMVAAAKARIINVIIGLVAYLFIYGFLQFIIPGGYF